MNTPRKKPEQGKLIGLAIVLLFTAPQFIIPIAIIWGIVTLVKKNANQQSFRQASFDDCPQKIFCFHKDKGEHHVRKGKEIDPWDRPDIDISKYQRNH